MSSETCGSARSARQERPRKSKGAGTTRAAPRTGAGRASFRRCRTFLATAALCLCGAPTAGELLSKADKAAYSRAFAAAERNDWPKAHRLARSARERLPAKALLWLDMTRPDTRRTFSEIASFVQRNPEWPRLPVLRRAAERSPIGEASARDLLKWFEKHPPTTTDGRLRLIDASIAAGRDVRSLVRETWISSAFGRTQDRDFRRRFGRHLRKSDHAARLDRLLWRGSFAQAKRVVRRVARPVRALAEARMALSALRGGVDRLIRQVPASLRDHPGLVYERVRWRRRKGLAESALDLLRKVPATAPHPEKWWTERSIAARELIVEGQASKAYRLAAGHGFSEGARFAHAEWFLGWIALRFLRKPETAARHFETMRRSVKRPISKARAAYWAGRAAKEANDRKTAAARFHEAGRHETTFYGQLAIAEAGLPLALKRQDVRPTPAQTVRFRRDERVRAALMLKEIGAADRSRPFLRRLLTPDPERLVQTARLAAAVGHPDISVLAGRRAYREGLRLPEIAYPAMKIAGAPAERELVLALIRQESNFRPDAISSANARGLMQIKPDTARETARGLKIRFSRDRLTADPAYNLRIGRAYLSRMLGIFDGSYALAVAAYNAGPAAVTRWIGKYGDPRGGGVLDWIDWIETLPYPETRNYVQRVLEALQVYRAMSGKKKAVATIVEDLRR